MTKKTTSKKATKAAASKTPTPRKGEIYETSSGQLVEVTNGRLKDEGEQGMSFEGRRIEFNVETGNPNRSKTADRFYLDELARKLAKKDYDEWVEAGKRESEALADAANAEPADAEQAAKKPAKAKAKKPKADGKLSQLDAAVKVLEEAAEPMATKAMVEAMAAKGYWTSPGGATPHATLYSAILRELQKKGDEARFEKVDRGRFALRGQTAPPPATAAGGKTKSAKGKAKNSEKPADGTPGPKSVSELMKI